MLQEAIITKIRDDGLAEVVVENSVSAAATAANVTAANTIIS